MAGFESATSRVRQRRIGKFRKIVRLPPEVDQDKINAKWYLFEGQMLLNASENGLLEITIPKRPEQLGKRITVA
jgi:HSP20 family molecular chaperone IbpA